MRRGLAEPRFDPGRRLTRSVQDPIDPVSLVERRRAAQAERLKTAGERWRGFQAASRKRYAARIGKRPPLALRRILARAKQPGRMLLLSTSGVWDAGLDESLGSLAGPAASLRDYVAAGPDPAVQPRALFDQRWYLEHAAGLAGSQWAPLAHYLVVGDGHNLSPHPLLDAPAYRARHGAKMATGRLTALEHFLFEGAAEGAAPHPLFDTAFYVGQSDAVARSGENPLVHYLRSGWREGLDPHPLFAGAWYLEQNPDAAEAGVAPLLHYVLAGGAEGRSPHPLFDTAHYVKQVRGRLRGGDPLSDFLTAGARELKSPNAHFKPAYYLEQTRDAAARANPLLHYLTTGAFAGAWPAPDFDEPGYFTAHPDAADSPFSALEHWVRNRTARGAGAAPVGRTLSAETLFADLREATAPDPAAYRLPAYQALRETLGRRSGDATPVRVIALRKTACPDWLAVARGLPSFRGHLQPRLPAAGFADPADPAAFIADVLLAERYGLAGFCHEVAGAEALGPILAQAFPFCLAWTGPDDPAMALKALAPALKARHAIRLDGRPVLALPAGADAGAWREAAGSQDLFLIDRGGGGAGFDGRLAEPDPRAPEGPPGPVINPDFRGLVHDYAAVARERLAGAAEQIPLVVAARDTTPRSQDAPVVWQGASPGAFQAWLEGACDQARDGLGLVFVEAWNDWERGCAIAPDLKFGHGWLEAIANAADADLLDT